MVNYRRSFEEVFHDGNRIFSVFPIQGIDTDFTEPKNVAIVEVLRRIPETDFLRLEEMTETFEWFIPHYDTLGTVMPFYCTHPEEPSGEGNQMTLKSFSRVLYLSPLLGDVDKDIAVAVVAHELAHIILDHILISSPEEYNRQEDEAWKLVRKWGFEKEIAAREKHMRELGYEEGDFFQ